MSPRLKPVQTITIISGGRTGQRRRGALFLIPSTVCVSLFLSPRSFTSFPARSPAPPTPRPLPPRPSPRAGDRAEAPPAANSGGRRPRNAFAVRSRGRRRKTAPESPGRRHSGTSGRLSTECKLRSETEKRPFTERPSGCARCARSTRIINTHRGSRDAQEAG